MSEVKLYSYFRSSSAYRVRAALNYKDIDFEYIPVHLVKDGGEQHLPGYREINPLGELPSLVHQGKVLGQSMAIIQYIDQVWPRSPLFPKAAYDRAKVIQVCEIVNSGIQPIQNLKVLQELEKRFGQAKAEWSAHWITLGFEALEKTLEPLAGNYCFGGDLTAADLYVVPQAYNARRFKVDMSQFPIISRIEQNCLQLPAFQKAHPEAQPDHQG